MVNIRAGAAWLGSTVISVVFEYDTPKFVHIRNKKIGLLNRLVQLGILGYIIGYGIVWQHGAQEVEQVQSVVTTKVKGVSVSTNSREFSVNCRDDWSVYDHMDLVVPPEAPNSFFVATNMWVTCNQIHGQCPEDTGVFDAKCSNDSDCPVDVIIRSGNGLTTGVCNETVGTCMITGWCPTENENDTLTAEGPVIDTQNFTVLIKNSISFPHLDKSYRVRNIPEYFTNKTFLKSCQFDPNDETSKFCPIFTLRQIVDMVNSSDGYYEKLATEGAIVGLDISWDCNLDISSTHCRPKYSARRLDNPDALISPGFNFRYAKYYRESGQDVRDVWKVYGIKFVVQVSGQGRKFSFITLVLALGSTIALLAIATVVTDIIALYLLKKGPAYREKKYQKVSKEDIEADEASNVNQTDSETLPLIHDKKSSKESP